MAPEGREAECESESPGRASLAGHHPHPAPGPTNRPTHSPCTHQQGPGRKQKPRKIRRHWGDEGRDALQRCGQGWVKSQGECSTAEKGTAGLKGQRRERQQELRAGAAILWELFLPPHKPASQADPTGRVIVALISEPCVEASPESIRRGFQPEGMDVQRLRGENSQFASWLFFF